MSHHKKFSRRKIELHTEMTVLVRTIVRGMLPVLLIFGMYIVTYGHLSPGGGFQGGMIVAGAVMSLYLAFGRHSLHNLREDLLHRFEHVGALAYLACGVLGLLAGLPFLTNTVRGGAPGTLFSGGLVFVLNGVVGLKVAVGTLLVLLILLTVLQKGDPHAPDHD